MEYKKSNIIVLQNMYLDKGEIKNEYYLRLPNGLLVDACRLPADRQWAFDAVTLDIMCKALAIRWGVAGNKKGRN